MVEDGAPKTPDGVAPPGGSQPPGGGPAAAGARKTPGGGPAAAAVCKTARTLSFLAFDYGLKRTGVATGNTLLGRASPLTTLAAVGEARFAPISQLVREWQPDALVIGVPLHPDGAPHDNTRRAQRFGRQLQGRFHLPVHEVDERYSSTEALASGAADVDAASAVVILDQYLRSLG